jgi:hypothetical protein
MKRILLSSAVLSVLICVCGCSELVSSSDSSQWAAPVGSSAVVGNVIVYKEAGRFCGWPANNGGWNWGDEILVGFALGYFLEPDPNIDAT